MAFYLNICRDHAILETSYFYSCTGNSRINRSGTETWARCKPGLLVIRMGPGGFTDNSNYGPTVIRLRIPGFFPVSKKGGTTESLRPFTEWRVFLFNQETEFYREAGTEHVHQQEKNINRRPSYRSTSSGSLCGKCSQSGKAPGTI